MKIDSNLLEQIEWLCETYYEDVYRYCLYFTNSRVEAEDLTQETFIKVLKGLSKFQHRSNWKTWVLAIAKNTAIDHYRRKKLIEFLPDSLLYGRKSNDASPEKEFDVKEEWEEVERALLTLKPAYRNVVILRGIQELTVKETAEILNCSEQKVRVDYHRALKQLQNKLVPVKGGALVDEKF